MPFDTPLSSLIGNNTSAKNPLDASNNAAAGNVSRVSIGELVGADTFCISHVVPWHQQPPEYGHRLSKANYNSADPAQCDAQVRDMKERGFDCVWVSWQGVNPTNIRHKACDGLLAACTKYGLNFCVAIDQAALGWNANPDKTALLREWLTWLKANYFQADAYWRIDGRPVFGDFSTELQKVDYNLLPPADFGNPHYLFRNKGGYAKPYSMGAYQWIDSGWSYLQDFNKWLANNPQTKMTVGSVFKGFNNSTASWAAKNGGTEKDIVIPQDRGRLFLDTCREVRYMGFPFIQFNTWNDYEEGTSLECGIDSGVTVSADFQRGSLAFKVTGEKAAVHHCEVWVAPDVTDPNVLCALLAPNLEVLNGSDSVWVGDSLPTGKYQFIVRAVGQPCFQNKFTIVKSEYHAAYWG
jgi:hypothetical protein